MKTETKLVWNNILIFIFFVIVFLQLYNLAGVINNEISFRNYLQSQYSYFNDEPEQLKFEKSIIVFLAICLILILNQWWYAIKLFFKNKREDNFDKFNYE